MMAWKLTGGLVGILLGALVTTAHFGLFSGNKTVRLE